MQTDNPESDSPQLSYSPPDSPSSNPLITPSSNPLFGPASSPSPSASSPSSNPSASSSSRVIDLAGEGSSDEDEIDLEQLQKVRNFKKNKNSHRIFVNGQMNQG